MFLSDPGMVPLPRQPDLFYLESPLIWQDDLVKITAPAGFISDDASVPKFLDWIPFLDRQGLSRRPGLMHDALYSLGRGMGKLRCDSMLEKFCLAEGMSAWQAHSYFLGVHWFGASSWAGDDGHGVVNPAVEGDFVAPEYYRAWLAQGAMLYSKPWTIFA